MRCRRHPNCEADNVCLECGGHFCPECVRETGVTYQCPDCREAEIERIAAQLGVGKRKQKKLRVKKLENLEVKAPVEAVLVGEERPDEVFPEVEEEPEGVIIAKEEIPPFQRRRLRKPKEGRGDAEILFLKEIPARVEEEPVISGAEFQIEPSFGKTAGKADDAVILDETAAGEVVVPKTESEDFWKDIPRAKERMRTRKKPPLALQYPEEYDDYRTARPAYVKAFGAGALAGAICAGAYGGLAWWRHREFGIIGWLIGAAIALAVVYGSGKHFNLKLGLMSAFLALLFVSAGRIFVYMLEVWFPEIIKLPIGALDNFNHAMKQFVNQLPTQWLAFLLISAMVAFLLSFRPWPFKLRASSGGGDGLEGSAAKQA